jgi:hypothetical protein
MEEVKTDRYHLLGSSGECLTEVFAVLKPGNNSQRLFQRAPTRRSACH